MFAGRAARRRVAQALHFQFHILPLPAQVDRRGHEDVFDVAAAGAGATGGAALTLAAGRFAHAAF